MLCTCLILGYGSNLFKYHIDNESLKSNKPMIVRKNDKLCKYILSEKR